MNSHNTFLFNEKYSFYMNGTALYIYCHNKFSINDINELFNKCMYVKKFFPTTIVFDHLVPTETTDFFFNELRQYIELYGITGLYLNKVVLDAMRIDDKYQFVQKFFDSFKNENICYLGIRISYNGGPMFNENAELHDYIMKNIKISTLYDFTYGECRAYFNIPSSEYVITNQMIEMKKRKNMIYKKRLQQVHIQLLYKYENEHYSQKRIAFLEYIYGEKNSLFFKNSVSVGVMMTILKFI